MTERTICRVALLSAWCTVGTQQILVPAPKMQLSDLVKQKWEKIFPFIQVNNWRGSNCLLICQQKFGSLALWHDEIAEMLQLHVLASSSSSPWNTGMSVHSLFLIYTSTPALLSAGPDL